MSTALPELWSDWCCATGAPEGQIDEASLSLFSRQVRPSKAELARLRSAITPIEERAPAWPSTMLDFFRNGYQYSLRR